MTALLGVIISLLFVLHDLASVSALRDHNGLYPLIPDYSEHYYYLSLREKALESMSVNNCSIAGDVSYGTVQSHGPDIYVKILPPPQRVIDKWGSAAHFKNMNNYKNMNKNNENSEHNDGDSNDKSKSKSNSGRLQQRIFAHVSPNLCSSQRFRELARGVYKRAKGCYKVYGPDKRTGKIVKRINDYGATLHPEHVRCEHQVVSNICTAGANGMQLVDEKYRVFNEFPFVIHAQRVIVGRGGMFAMPCGPFGLFASCEAVKCGLAEAAKVVPHVQTCRDASQKCPFPKYDKVFVLTQYDDTQIGQFIQENLPKLVYHLEYLQQHPEVKIHFGFTKRDVLPSYVLPHNFFSYFGLQDRFINGTVYAEEIIMPREGGCQDIGYNIWETMAMRETFFQLLGIEEDANFQKTYKNGNHNNLEPSIVILTRSPGDFTQNKADASTRRWDAREFPAMVRALKSAFPGHTVELFQDSNATLMRCPLCQAEIFSRAEIVIGHHGAGLSNAVFMRPGGVMVEVVYNFDSRHLPVLGIFPRIADLVGLHHFSYYVKDVRFNGTQFAEEVADFAKKAQLWAHS